MNTNRTEAQTAALLALAAQKSTGSYTATDLGVSGAAMAALVRMGLAQVATTWRADLFKETTTYKITGRGIIASKKALRSA